MKTERPKPNSKPPFQTRLQPSTIFAPGGQEGVLSPEDVVRLGPCQRYSSHRRCSEPGLSARNNAKISRHGRRLNRLRAPNTSARGHSTGILCGRKDLIDAAYLHSFIGYETSPYDTIGRPLKVDRQEVIAVVVALREWFSMDPRSAPIRIQTQNPKNYYQT